MRRGSFNGEPLLFAEAIPHLPPPPAGRQLRRRIRSGNRCLLTTAWLTTSNHKPEIAHRKVRDDWKLRIAGTPFAHYALHSLTEA